MGHPSSSRRLALESTRIGDTGHLTVTRTHLSSYRPAGRRVDWQKLVRYQLVRLQRSSRRSELSSKSRYYRYHFPCT